MTPYASVGKEPAYSIKIKTFRVTENVPALGTPYQYNMANPHEAAVVAHGVWNAAFDLDRESIAVFTCNGRNDLTGFRAWHGTIDFSTVYPREILEACLRLSASGFVVVHNHPSGDTMPSQADINITEHLQTAARCLGLRFLDHLIIDVSNVENVYSFRSNGLLT